MTRRASLSAVGAAGLLGTFGLMAGAGLTATLGTIAFAPWVALLGFDLGLLGGAAVGVATLLLWWLATWIDSQSAAATGTQLDIRLVVLVVLGAAAGLAGRRLRASERAQSATAALQSALIDATLDGICLTDRRGNILITNAPLRHIARELGMPGEGTVEERLLAITDRLADPERYVQRMHELATEAGATTSDEFELAGTGRVFQGFTAPVSTPDGTFAGRIWTLREVTADRELDRMRDAFVATVSHELRTPLTSISGFLEMMEDEEDALGETGRTYLNVIRRSAERLQTLVEDLLLIAQIEAHRVELELRPVDLRLLAARSAEAARPAAEEKGVSLEVADGDGVPAVAGDERRLAQVLDNLVSNAVKFTGNGGRVRISVAGNGDGAVSLVVADTGVGIPHDELGQVFSRFFRASTATRRAIPGTGLGLAISRALVEQHGGSIALSSIENEGTQVTVTLPAAA